MPPALRAALAIPEFTTTASKLRTAPLWGLRTHNQELLLTFLDSL